MSSTRPVQLSKAAAIAQADFIGQLQLTLGEAHRVALRIGNSMLALALNMARNQVPEVKDIPLLASGVAALQIKPDTTFETLIEDLQTIMGSATPMKFDVSGTTPRERQVIMAFLTTTVDLAKAFLQAL